ncbi:hypothetical protein P879_11841 [Paragonimus westermani]|uniref:Uncharacterized protein n=1 Tax=Paragonimus westermani TaxID=34504 RepID=A0A8T0D831_9TREM|nr:hypothetical protein P879_11841 [Paragonimus westermani]
MLEMELYSAHLLHSYHKWRGGQLARCLWSDGSRCGRFHQSSGTSSGLLGSSSHGIGPCASSLLFYNVLWSVWLIDWGYVS